MTALRASDQLHFGALAGWGPEVELEVRPICFSLILFPPERLEETDQGQKTLLLLVYSS